MNIPTMKVKPWGEGQGDHVLINVTDFDPAIHERLDGDDAPLPVISPYEGWSRLAMITALTEAFKVELDEQTDQVLRDAMEGMERRKAWRAEDAGREAEVEAPAADPPPEANLGPVEIAADWSDLHWTKRVVLAKVIAQSDDALTAEQANEVIIAELARRELDAPIEEVGGLTLRELRADIGGLGLEVDPTMPPADLLALRDAKRAERAAANGQA